MKIAIFSDTFQMNGVTSTVHESAKSLAELGHEVCVFIIGKNPKKKVAAASSENLSFVSLPSLSVGWIYPNERLYVPLGFSYFRLKKFAPDIIHTHMPFTLGWEAIALAKILKIPIVGTHHTFYDHYLKHVKIDYNWGRVFSWKYTTLFYNFCDLVITASSALAQTLSQQGLKKSLLVIPNSTDTGLFKPVSDDLTKQALKKDFGITGQSLVYMGRLSYEKSIDKILQAFAQLLPARPKLKLMMIGDGPEKIALKKLAAKLNIEKNIIFTGTLFDNDLVQALQANDIFLTASKSENFGIAILEAMACGLPIISVKEKGLAELIKDDINGYFVRTDDPDDMAQKASILLDDSEKLKSFGLASRQLALGYSKEIIIARIENFYQSLIKKKDE